jgi:hypothetical protein
MNFTLISCICGLFNDGVGNSDHVASNNLTVMTDLLEEIWKAAFLSQFKVLSQHLHEGDEETHDKPKSGWAMSWPR